MEWFVSKGTVKQNTLTVPQASSPTTEPSPPLCPPETIKHVALDYAYATRHGLSHSQSVITIFLYVPNYLDFTNEI